MLVTREEGDDIWYRAGIEILASVLLKVQVMWGVTLRRWVTSNRCSLLTFVTSIPLRYCQDHIIWSVVNTVTVAHEVPHTRLFALACARTGYSRKYDTVSKGQ
jgi:hypothetical protein